MDLENHAFDDDGSAIQTAGPIYPDDESDVTHDENPLDEDLSRARQEAVVRLIGWLSAGGSALSAGRRVMILAHVLGLPGSASSLRKLGRELGCSHVHAARLCNRLRAETLGIIED